MKNTLDGLSLVVETSGWSNSKPAIMAVASLTSKWRPLFELVAASPVLSVSSGLVPDSDEDGWSWRLSFSSECEGPDCFLLFPSRVFLAKTRNCVVVFLFFVSYCNLYLHLLQLL
jgi:hypothetical protein